MANLTDGERRAIIDELLERSIDGVLSRGLLSEVAARLGRNRSTIAALWRSFSEARSEGFTEEAWKSKIKANSGRKRVDRDVVRAKIESVAIDDRQVIRHAAKAAGVSAYMVYALLKEGVLTRRTTRIKPALTPANKLRRIEFALSHVDESAGAFEPMLDVVHADEKWFYADRDKRSYLLLDGETLPPRRRQSKRFIPKTMFLAAVARPRWDPHRKQTWDGKIGVWAFTEEYVAQRSSPYRPKGSVCVRNIESVDKSVYKRYLTTFLFPAIKEKWPRQHRRHLIVVQQDNAKPHVSPFDPDILTAGSDGGWNIRLAFQPPNSPDMNVLDLGLFASLQSLQYRQTLRGIDDIVRAVGEAFGEMSSVTMDNIFLSLQNCMRSTLMADGDNIYTLPHLGKEKIRNAGTLPPTLACEAEIFEKALATLRASGRASALFF